MPRAARGQCVNGIYHVYQRGNNKEFLFAKDEVKGMFIHIIKDFMAKFDFELLGFVIMSNHYHMIIKVNKDSLNLIMFNINNVFARYLNKNLERTGHVFETRYKSKWIDNDSYLLWLLRYTHRNPIRAKMVGKIDDYKWSSHYFYKNALNGTVNIKFILSMISNKKDQAVLQYVKFMNTPGNDNDEEEDYKICCSSFINNMEKVSIPFDLEVRSYRKTLEEVAQNIFTDEEERSLVFEGSKQRKLTPIKLAFIKEALLFKYTFQEIADYLNTSESTVRTIINRNNAKCKCAEAGSQI